MNRKAFAPFAAVGLVLALAASPASAEEPSPDPVGGIVKGVTGLLQPKQNEVKTTVIAPNPPASDDDIPPNETTDPVEPDHASTRGIESGVGGQSLVGVSRDNATVNDDDTTSADSTALALGGMEIAGAHASSTGDNEDSFNILAPVCVSSGGAICLDVLYAEAEATDDGTTSTAHSSSGIVGACIGGTNTDPMEECDGPISLGLGASEATIVRDQPSGQTVADSSFVALGLADTAVLYSFGEADSDDPANTNRGSFLIGTTAEDDVIGPQLFAIPPGCPNPSVVCAFFNQGETYLAPGIGGTAQDALLSFVLPFTPAAVFLGVGHTETLVHNDGGEIIDPCLEDEEECEPDPCEDEESEDEDCEEEEEEECEDDESDDDCDEDEQCEDDENGDEDGDEECEDDDDGDKELPDTGGPASGLLALGLLAIALGYGLIAAGRVEPDES